MATRKKTKEKIILNKIASDGNVPQITPRKLSPKLKKPHLDNIVHAAKKQEPAPPSYETLQINKVMRPPENVAITEKKPERPVDEKVDMFKCDKITVLMKKKQEWKEICENELRKIREKRKYIEDIKQNKREAELCNDILKMQQLADRLKMEQKKLDEMEYAEYIKNKNMQSTQPDKQIPPSRTPQHINKKLNNAIDKCSDKYSDEIAKKTRKIYSIDGIRLKNIGGYSRKNVKFEDTPNIVDIKKLDIINKQFKNPRASIKLSNIDTIYNILTDESFNFVFQ